MFCTYKTPCINRVDVNNSLCSLLKYGFMNERKTSRLELRLTLEEKDRLYKMAKENNKTVAQYVREVVLNGKLVTKTDVQTVIELKRIGNNLNQIAKQINLIPHEDNVKLYLQEIQDLLKMVSDIAKK